MKTQNHAAHASHLTRLLSAAMLTGYLWLAPASLAATYQWITGREGDFGTDGNWKTLGIPGPADFVIMPGMPYGGTCRIHDGQVFQTDRMRIYNGVLEMTGGTYIASTLDTVWIGCQGGDSWAHGQAFDVSVRLSGNAHLSARQMLAGMDQFWARAPGMQPTTITLEDKAKITLTGAGDDDSHIGREGGQIVITLKDKAEFRDEGKSWVYFGRKTSGNGQGANIVDENSQPAIATLLLEGDAVFETQSRFRLGDEGAQATVRVGDNAQFLVRKDFHLAWTGGPNSDLPTVANFIMNGGVFETPRMIRANEAATPELFQINFTIDGGTIRAAADEPSFFQFMSGAEPATPYGRLENQGATFDTNGHAVGLRTVFEGDAGLTITGGGSFSLEREQAYAGVTTVRDGTLILNGGCDLSGDVAVERGATLRADSDPNNFVYLENLVMEGDSHLHFTNLKDPDSYAPIVAQGDLSVSGPVTVQVHDDLAEGDYPILEYGGAFDSAQVENFTLASTVFDGTFRTDGDGNVTMHLTAKESTGGYATWAAALGLDAGNNDPQADPDQDGVPNALEYYLAGNPLETDASILPRVVLAPEGPTLTFTRRTGVAGEFAIQNLEVSDELVTWEPVLPVPPVSVDLGEVLVIVTPHLDGTETVQIRPSAGAWERLFARLRVELNP